MTLYRVGAMNPDDVDSTFALVHLVRPDLGLEDWRGFSASALSSMAARDPTASSVVVARNPNGYISGIAVSAMRPDPLYEWLLDVPVFLVVSAFDDHGVAAELLAYLRETAIRRHCHAMRFSPPERDEWLRHEAVSDSDGSFVLPVERRDAAHRPGH